MNAAGRKQGMEGGRKERYIITHSLSLKLSLPDLTLTNAPGNGRLCTEEGREVWDLITLHKAYLITPSLKPKILLSLDSKLTTALGDGWLDTKGGRREGRQARYGWEEISL